MNLLLGVTGSISIYKSIELLRIFQKSNNSVSVVMTRSAKELVSPLIFETFAPGRVYSELFNNPGKPILHIDLAKDSDLLLIAPATANIIGKMANGIADDLLSTVFISFYKKVIISPAMNTNMLNNSAVKDNLLKLKKRGVEIIEPDNGPLACSDEGSGRLPAPDEIFKFCMERVK